jgi:FtsH-binding integral membrane protein
MSESSPPPASLPPIPDGCGILPIAENLIHPGATGSGSPHSPNECEGGPRGFDPQCDPDPMERHYRRVLARALALCSAALLLTAAVSASLAGTQQNFISGRLASNAIFVTQLLFVAFCSRFVQKLSLIPAGILLFAYAAFCGLEFSSLLPPTALAAAFLCAGLMYAATAFWGFARGSDLARPVVPIFMIPAGGVILVAVNVAFGTPRFAWTFSSIAVVGFAMLAGCHAQQIRDFYQDFDDDNAEGWKASLVGALLLLLNSVNFYLLVAGALAQVAALMSGDDEKQAMRDDLPN